MGLILLPQSTQPLPSLQCSGLLPSTGTSSLFCSDLRKCGINPQLPCGAVPPSCCWQESSAEGLSQSGGYGALYCCHLWSLLRLEGTRVSTRLLVAEPPGSGSAFVCRVDWLVAVLSFFLFSCPTSPFSSVPPFFCLTGLPSSPSSRHLRDRQREWACDHSFILSLRPVGRADYHGTLQSSNPAYLTAPSSG